MYVGKNYSAVSPFYDSEFCIKDYCVAKLSQILNFSMVSICAILPMYKEQDKEDIMRIGFLLICVFYFLINGYLAHRILSWLKAIWHGFTWLWLKIIYYVLYAAAAVLPVFGFVLPDGRLQEIMIKLGYYWIGIFAYLFMGILLLDLFRGLGRVTRILKKEWIGKRSVKVIAGAVVCILVAGVCSYGFYHARQLQVKEYDVTLDKTVNGTAGITLALISDTHFGYNIGTERAREIVDKVNAMDADIICFAGDIFDNRYDAIAEPEALIEILKELKSTYGVYACFGNHDVDASASDVQVSQMEDNQMVEFLEKAGVKLLRDEAVLIDYQFYLVGRLDARPIGVSAATRKSANLLLTDLNRALPVIVLDHQPTDLKALDESGADLVLSGHTHNGQIFPGNLLIRLLNENGYGYYKRNHLQSVVTSGAGLWGPYMRVGSDCEVVKININFGK